MEAEEKKGQNRLASPFIQRFLVKLPDYLKNDKIAIVKVEEHNLEPIVTLTIAGTSYSVIHELLQNRTRVLEGDKLILTEAENPGIIKDFLDKVLNE